MSIPRQPLTENSINVAMMPDEVLEEVFSGLLVPEIVGSISTVSRRFNGIVNRDKFWKHKFEGIVNHQRNNEDDGEADGFEPSYYESPQGLSRHQLQRCCWLLEHKANQNKASTDKNIIGKNDSESDCDEIVKDETHRSVLPSWLQHGSLLFGQKEACRLLHSRADGLQRVVSLASSTDYDHEGIENVLHDENVLRQEAVNWNRIQNDDRMIDAPVMEGWKTAFQSEPWWSSEQHSSQESPETLAFSTRYPSNLVTEVAIKPYADWTLQTYSWKKWMVRVYNLQALRPPSMQMIETDDDEGHDLPDIIYHTLCPSPALLPSSQSSSYPSVCDHRIVSEAQSTTNAFQYLEAQTPVYESEPLETPPPRNNAWQYHKLPVGVIGNVITITLLGKNFRQFDTSGYYACVQHVATQGIPLHESTRDFGSLKFNPREAKKQSMMAHMVSEVVPLLVR